ncbi:hypothetical protein NDU88_006768 [Pleurodeles waltl]|uniref:Uncharacterized protein n=1 Tax=Pleurodeles waltl TaxID=8319 RepID=A0AAV7RME4_PLEWA|nr:hypothetical protein NDU88_006768 [Pleurodeles waltl]
MAVPLYMIGCSSEKRLLPFGPGHVRYSAGRLDYWERARPSEDLPQPDSHLGRMLTIACGAEVKECYRASVDCDPSPRQKPPAQRRHWAALNPLLKKMMTPA